MTSIKAAVREANAKSLARTTVTLVASPFTFKGRNATIRNAALAGIASLAYAEGQSRADMVTQLKLTLGNKPSVDEVKAVAQQYVIGRTAQKIAAENKGKSVAELIAYASQLVTLYAAPAQDGVAPRKLRKGQLGRRSVSEHKAIRAAESAWSLIKAEIAPEQSSAQTLAEKNKRSTRKTPVRGNKTAGLTHSELVKPDGKPHTRESATAYIAAMSQTLLAFCNKHAAVIPAEYGMSVKRFHGAIAQLGKDAE